MNIKEDKYCWMFPEQRELLIKIFSTPMKDCVYFAGGTCLSVFYLNHRRSNDIDIFFYKERDLTYYKEMFHNLGLQPKLETTGFCSYTYQNTKVDFVMDMVSLPDKYNYVTIDGIDIRIDVPENFIVNKLTTLVSRMEVRDYVDFALLYNKYFQIEDFDKILDKAKLREGALEDINILKEVFKYAYNFIEANFSKLLLTHAVSLNKLFLVYYKLLEHINQNIPL
jgi:predicted nucleotidyltransferase component of viral defense system